MTRMASAWLLLGLVVLATVGVTGAGAQDFAKTLDRFVALLPADLNQPSALKVGEWALRSDGAPGSVPLYAHTDRAKKLEATLDGGKATVFFLDGKVCGIRVEYGVSHPDLAAARTAIFGRLGKTMEVHKNPSGDVSYNYRNKDRSVRLYLGTTNDQLVLSLEDVKPHQELWRLKNTK